MNFSRLSIFSANTRYNAVVCLPWPKVGFNVNKKSALGIAMICIAAGLFFTGGLSRRPEAPPRAAAAGTAENETAAAPFHIGIVTGSAVQGTDDLLGARAMVRLYGDAEDGGMIRHVLYPDDFTGGVETTVSRILSLADDPLVKVIVVNQAAPGTVEAFRKVKEKRPDIICLAGEAHEDPNEIASAADLVVNCDFISRGYLLPYVAKRLGAKAFVHVSFPRHLASVPIARRRALMKRACGELGMTFADEEAPDPTGGAGVEGARKFITEAFPAWAERYGKDTAFFCTNDAHTEPLLRQVAENGCFFVEADIPSPLLGYPGAFGVEISEGSDDWQAILKKIESAVVKAGGGGRMGTWAYPLGFNQSAGMAEFGRLLAEGRTHLSDTKALLDCYGKFSPGADWNGSYYTDAVTAKPVKNYFLVYQDTYIFGTGYMKTPEVEIPLRYFE
jgi:hypothetical protein